MATLDLKKSIHEKLLCFQFLKTSSIILFATFLTQNLNAQVETNFSAGGAVRVGDSSTACDASIEGAIRFDADGADTIDYCNGTSWLTLLTSSLAGDVNQGGNSFAAPMIIGTNDNNTLAFETNGSTRMTINTSGNVGIGSTTPGRALDVVGSAAVTGDYFLPNTGGHLRSGGSRVYLESTSDLVSFYTNGLERMRIDGSRVGVGTTAPNTILDINGAESMRGMAAPAVSPAGQGRIYFDSTSNKYRVSQNGGAYSDLVGGGSGDFMASGTVPMTGELELLSENSATDPDLTFNGDENTGLFQPAADEIAFSNAGTESLRIDASGNFGIGTNNPNADLHVYGTNGIIFEKHINDDYPIFMEFHRNRLGPVNSSTKLALLDFKGADGSSIQRSAAQIEVAVDGTPGANDMPGRMTFLTTPDNTMVPVERMRIDNAGNIGIGTNNPNKLLDIEGTNGSAHIHLTRTSGSSDSATFYMANYADTAPTTGSTFMGMGSRGTFASPAALQDGDIAFFFLGQGASDAGWNVRDLAQIEIAAEENITNTSSAGRIVFKTTPTSSTTPTEAMRIDSSGYVGIGTNNPGFQLTVNDSRSTNPVAEFENGSTNSDADGIRIEIGPNSNPGSNNHFIQFRDGDGTVVGSVEGNGSGGVSYQTTSDRRIKTDIKNTRWDIKDLLNTRVVDYRHIDGSKVTTGFIAQELHEIFPHLVSPASDENDLWTVDYTMMIPLVTKSVQQLHGMCQITAKDLQRINNLSLQNKRDIASLKEENIDLKERVKKLESLVEKLLENKK